MKKCICLAWVFFCSLALYAQKREVPYVLLISFDGFRSDYVERFDLPNFKEFIKDGVAATSMLPSFPSKTFPNHYTIVTGLYPGHHGLVDNSFYDPNKKVAYGMKNHDVVVDRDFYGGKPLWQLAKENNIRSASYFWVGSELPQEKLHPDYFYSYDQGVPFSKRVDQVIDWLVLPAAERPHVITLYFHSPDTESHKHGPLAEATKEKVKEMDALLGKLMFKLDSIQVPVNTFLVSDHGMSEMDDVESTYVFVDDYVKSTSTITVSNGGTQVHIYTKTPAQTDSLYNVLNSKPADFSVMKKSAFPERWHYQHERAGDILLVIQPGKYFLSGSREKMRENWAKGGKFGAHGFDPDSVKEMAGIFYAKGPNIKKGMTIQSFRNIHVYPLIAAILGVTPGAIDGDLKVLKPILRR